ncbi:unnamed protein product, partial [Mesorhabditis belari]|uniref:C-type lectin domain-containing protein n=1 Tax=Mesorhabditis belari TaxID=2138241 RepID=A0AAF3JBE2_9BILA
MKYFSFFSSLFFSLSISLVDSFKCPNRSDQVPNEDVCMVAVSQAGVYANAAQGCSSFSGMPVKIQNLFENSFIYSYLLPGELNGVAPYIGIQRKNKIEWVYADGSTLIYQNWAPNEPNNESNTSACAIMDSQTAKWISTDCTSARPFVCSIDENS